MYTLTCLNKHVCMYVKPFNRSCCGYLQFCKILSRLDQEFLLGAFAISRSVGISLLLAVSVEHLLVTDGQTHDDSQCPR